MAAVVERTLSVALLGRADEARAQLRQALDELGASVVVEADPSGIDIAAVTAGKPQVVLLNLEPGLEDALDHLQPLFDDPAVRVVFNDAEVSSQLSGWDRARWARHLAAKLLGHSSINPPAPAGSEALPDLNIMPSPGAPLTPAQMAGDVAIEGFALEAEDSAGLVPSERRLEESSADDGFGDALSNVLGSGENLSEDDFGDFDLDLGGIQDALIESDVRPEVQGASVPDALPETDAAINFEFDPTVLDAAILSDVAPTAELQDSEREEFAATPPETSADADVLDEALSGFNLEDDADMRLGDLALDADTDANLDGDEDLAALAAQFDAQSADSAQPGLDAAGEFDFLGLDEETEENAEQLDSASEIEPAVPAHPAAAASSESRSFDLSGFSLEPMGDAADTPPAQAGTASASKAASSYDFDSLDLSLEPFAEESPDARPEPRNVQNATQQELAESASPATSGEIARVILLGASIGGPDALRSFLTELPADFPAVFLLAQHLDSGFFERLADQLQKVSKLTVKLPVDGARIGLGEVLVIGSGDRTRLDRKGNLSLEPFEARPAYTPSIDQMLKDAADTFGAQATAIIFSGMAGDAIEGAAYLVSRGGEVWIQDAASCVVSSMVDGIQSRGLCEFIGSPRELARQCITRFGQPV